MTKLRLATENDVPELVEMGADMFASSSFASMKYAPEKAAEVMRHGIKSGFLAVSIHNDQISGAMCGDVIEPWYSSDYMAHEYFLYVRPEFRGTRAALMLVKAWMHWAVASGAKQLRPATAATSESADRLYEAVGFKRAGSLFVMTT